MRAPILLGALALLGVAGCQDPVGTRITPLECFEMAGCPWRFASAHRGKCVEGIPENTLAAFDACEAAGVSMVELDLRVSADGQVVLMHDADVVRTTDGEVRFPGRTGVAELTAAELRSLTIDDPVCDVTPAAPTALPRRCRVATFEELLASDHAFVLMLDYKGGDLNALADTLNAAPERARARALFLDASLTTLQTMQALVPDLQLMPRAADAAEVDALLASGLRFSWLHADTGWLTEVRDPLHAEGVRLYANVFDLDVGLALAAETLDEAGYEAFVDETIRPTLETYLEDGLMAAGTERAIEMDDLLNPGGGFGCCSL